MARTLVLRVTPNFLLLFSFFTLTAGSAGDSRLMDDLRKAELALSQTRLEEAVTLCLKIIERDSKYAPAYYLLGTIYEQQGSKESAKQALLKSLKLDPGHKASHLKLGTIYLQEGDLNSAAKAFQTAAQLGDVSGASEYGLGLILVSKSKYAEARPLLLSAVRTDPKNAERLFALIAVELQLKQQTNARTHALQLARFHSRNPWVSYRLGTLFIDHQMLDDAQAQLERAATLLSGVTDLKEVQLSDLYLQLAQIRLTRQDNFAALQYLEKIDISKLSPELQPATLDLQGTALLALGRVAEARSKHQQAAQFDSSQSEHWEHWIWTELLTGRTTEASSLVAEAKKKWPRSLQIQKLASLVEREHSSERAHVPFSDEWHVKGEGLVCCPCAVPCPCRSNGPPTAGHCENVGTFRIETGHYGSVILDGLTFASAGCTMGSQVAPSVLYVNRETNDDQIIALERLYQSFLPLRPILFSEVRRKEIFFAKGNDGKAYEVTIPGSLEIKILRQTDAQGRPLFQTAAVDYFSNTIEYAKNVVYRVFDEELQLRWDFSRRQANFRVFDLQSTMYKQGMMLVQYSDGSGSFNKRQQELIQALRLPVLHPVPRSSRPINQSPTR